MNNMKVFVADDVNNDKLAPLREAGIKVIKETKLAPEELAERIKDADGVIVRSATHITAELMDKAEKLRVIGRAGVGVDNVDVKAATEQRNCRDERARRQHDYDCRTLQSLCLFRWREMFRKRTQNCKRVWDKKSFVGVELNGKTLGVIGLGRIGKHVAKIAKGFGMKIFAFDPFVSPNKQKNSALNSERLDEVFAHADFLTIHTPVTDETRNIIGKDAFAKMKKGVRVINCARGGLVDETALLEAIENGNGRGGGFGRFFD